MYDGRTTPPLLPEPEKVQMTCDTPDLKAAAPISAGDSIQCTRTRESVNCVERGVTCEGEIGLTCEEVRTVTCGDVNGHKYVSVDPQKDRETQSSQDQHSSPNGLRTCLEDARKVVDVRMIDFAHTTHSKCVQDPIKYSGPDEGYILGLDTLISAFTALGND